MGETSAGVFDVAVPLHAAAMLTVVQCGSALGKADMLDQSNSWFAAIEKTYARNQWSKHSFHMNAILLESFVVIASKVRKGSSFADEIEEFVQDLESYLQVEFGNDRKTWSFSGARAAVLRWAAAKKTAKKKKLATVIDEYMRRWKKLEPGLQPALSYTCVPLQGVSPLLMRRGDEAANLVSSV